MRRFIVLLLWGVAFPAIAADSVLSFDASLQLAAQYNADLRNARSSQEAAEYRVRSSSSGYWPQVSGSITYSDTQTPGNESYSTSITATQNLFAGFQDEARVQQAQANLEIAQQSLILAKAQLSRDLKVAYASLLYSQDNVTLTEDILRRLEENLRLVELKYESGRENKGSYLLTRAAVARGRLDQLQAVQEVASARAQLARVLGRGGEQHLRVTGAVPISDPIVVSDFDALVAATPDVRSAVASEKVSDADVRLARAGFYPNVSVSAGQARQDDRWYPDNRSNSVTASVSIPLFSGGRDWYGTRAALADLDATKANRESTEQQTLVRLRQVHAAYVESVERLKVDREFLDAAQTRASIARARYQNGLVSFDEWDRAESDLVQRQKAYLVSQRDRVTAEAAWELAQGKGIIL
ncbi:MAG TPA: TolC family protein [Burkholderiales bacterium]|nr:TolC family protein [Burkholderiales bacterium]